MSERPPRRPPLADASYTAVCAALGLVAGWIPFFLHGPIPEKFDVLYIDGSIAIWGYYVARCSIGLWVGISARPRRWYLRGPLCGFLAVLPLTLVSLAMPACGFPCMRANLASGAGVGWLVAGLARLLTGRSQA
ncbi:MAG: hypothetical protein WEF50_09320 [Myxococcota bacterium]